MSVLQWMLLLALIHAAFGERDSLSFNVINFEWRRGVVDCKNKFIPEI